LYDYSADSFLFSDPWFEEVVDEGINPVLVPTVSTELFYVPPADLPPPPQPVVRRTPKRFFTFSRDHIEKSKRGINPIH
jgi:hypothetical protein